MKRLALTLGCLLGGTAVLAAEPAVGQRVQPAGVATASQAQGAANGLARIQTLTEAQTAAPRPPLKLAIGDIREYMSAEEFRALSADREPERNTVIVEARVPLLPMKHESPVPGGIIAPFWALANPTQAWRIFLPDLNRPESGPLESKIPPPVFRWGP